MLCYSAILKCSKIESPESKARPQGSGRHAAPPGRKSKAPSPQILSALEIGNGGMNVVTTMKTLSSSLYSPLEYPYTNHSTRPYNNPSQEERSCQASNHSPRWREEPGASQLPGGLQLRRGGRGSEPAAQKSALR